MGQEFFTENFLTGFLPTLKDEVEEVRMAASAILPLLVSASTPLWIQEKICPSVRALSAESYIKRISFLNSLKSLLEAELPESFQTEVLNKCFLILTSIFMFILIVYLCILGNYFDYYYSERCSSKC